jgi:3-dehydroquinate dehydratase type I
MNGSSVAMTKISVTLVEESTEGVIAGIEKSKSRGADIVEVRADLLADSGQITSLLNELSYLEGRPRIIFTLRPSIEGGSFEGTDEQRVSYFEQAIECGLEYIDVELNMAKKYRDRIIPLAKDKGVKVIVSLHDFQKTPEVNEILKTIKSCIGSGGDIAKVVYSATTNNDLLNLVEAGLKARELDAPFSVMAVGRFGEISRILAPAMGCELVYASLDDNNKAYEGQLELDLLIRLKEIFKW